MKLFPVILKDHLGGFEKQLYNVHLYKFDAYAKKLDIIGDVVVTSFLDERVQKKYSNLNIKYSVPKQLWNSFENYNIHPDLNYKNFICSFNGSGHVSRQLLTSILNKFGYFVKGYCSKNSKQLGNEIDEHITYYVENTEFYNKFFDCTDEFNQQINSFGHVRFEHDKNIYNLENKLTQSFLHIVSETMATSYYPFLTEKFLYSIVTRGLFLTYAQPGWHAHIEKYYGFKLYTKLFDYRFDSIINPVERLVELMTIIGKFSKLTPHEWHDLYLLEQDNIEFNYNHYFSKDCLKSLI